MSGEQNRPLCPSAACVEGATLLGIVQADGRVRFIPQPLTVGDDFVAKARQGRAPEKRFRFAAPCATKACRQWTGTRCGVIDRVLDRLADPPASEDPARDLPACAIRTSCRWYDQRGAAACAVCPEIVTDTR